MSGVIELPIDEAMEPPRGLPLKPLLSPAIVETEKTGITYLVTNDEFMGEVFSVARLDASPVVVSFNGDPSRVRPGSWIGAAWDGKSETPINLPLDANNYFSLGSFRPDDSGRVRRRKGSFYALHAIMLDDVGTKVEMAQLTARPSWMLETSPGNHQAGYLLCEPLEDAAMADRLMKAIVDARLCDPGANGPTARLARLPVGMNGKRTPLFQCRMVEWSPALRYTVDELVDGLDLDVASGARPKRRSVRRESEPRGNDDQILLPRPEKNGVLAALKERDLYKAPLGEGKHDITCPWVGEHTGGVDGGTAYFEPDDKWPLGGFKCMHGHCADRHVRDLLRFLGVELDAARMKPTIRILAGEIHRIVDAGELELAHTKFFYQRGGLIVTVATDPANRETRVQAITQPALVRALAGAASWERYDLRSSEWVRTDPPARHTSVLFDSTSYIHLPVLNGLTRQPYLRADGTLMSSAGYDASTGVFGVFDTREFSVPDSPTRAEAETALEVLASLLIEFKFRQESDRAAALSAMLTAAVRPSLEHAPMFHVAAHMVGSGKSYLCELITAFATPQRGTPTTFPADDEECRKLLLAELLRAPAVIEFDNLTSDLVAHKSLCTALTSEQMTGRILGVSKTATVNTRALFLSSGNNVGPVQDMARRCITIHLDPGCEIPASRTFTRPNLVDDVLRERGRYVSAALTIVRAWISAQRPKIECRPLAGYGGWSDLCRQPLLWLGLFDATRSVFEAMTEDPDRETLDRVLTAWQSVFGNKPTMIRDAVAMSAAPFDDNVELREVLHDIAEDRGQLNRKRLGWWLKKHVGRIVVGRRLCRGTGKCSAQTWFVESVSPVSPVSPVSGNAREKVVIGYSQDAKDYVRASRGD